MGNVTGVVDGYSSKFNKASIQVNGTWYGTKAEWYKGPELDTLKGQTVSFDDGGGKFLKNVKVVAGGPSGEAPAARAPAVGFPIDPLDKQRSIIRQNSLAHATSVILNGGFAFKSPEDMAQAIVGLAPTFEAYSAGDTIREKVEAGLKAAETSMTADDVPF